MLIKIKKLLSSIKANDVIFYLMAITIFGYLTKYIFNIILTHYLRPSLFGDFNIAVRVLGIMTSFALLGTNYSSKRFMSRYLRLREHDNLQNYIKWNLQLIRVSFFICIAIAMSSYLIMHALHIWHIKDIRTYHLAIYMLWIAPLASILSLLATYLLCAEYPISYKLLTNMVYFFSICVFMVVVSTFNITFTSYTLVSILFISFTILVIIALLFIVKRIPYLFWNIVSAFNSKNTHAIHPDWVIVSVRMAANGLISLIIFSIDLIVIEVISPVEDTVGLYAVALTISSFLILIPQNLYSLLTVQVSELFSTEDGKKQLESNIRQLNRSSMIITLLIGMGIYVYSKTLLLHFGPTYLQSESALHILTIGFIINAYSQAATTVLGYAGHEKSLLTISIVELSTLLVLCIVLTYYFGIIGTATATALILTCKTIAGHVMTYRNTGIKTYAF